MKSMVAVLALLPFNALTQDVMRPPSDHTLLINGIVPPVQLRLPKWNCRQDTPTSVPPAKLGTTVVSYKVATDGSVKDLTLEKSGGSDVLDKQLMKCAAEMRFRPATKNGQVVEYPEKIRFDWSMGFQP